MDARKGLRIRRGPAIGEIAARAGVGTATVDRVLNARGNVAPATQLRVIEALAALQAAARRDPLRVGRRLQPCPHRGGDRGFESPP